jgi:hypothetical protein
MLLCHVDLRSAQQEHILQQQANVFMNDPLRHIIARRTALSQSHYSVPGALAFPGFQSQASLPNVWNLSGPTGRIGLDALLGNSRGHLLPDFPGVGSCLNPILSRFDDRLLGPYSNMDSAFAGVSGNLTDPWTEIQGVRNGRPSLWMQEAPAVGSSRGMNASSIERLLPDVSASMQVLPASDTSGLPHGGGSEGREPVTASVARQGPKHHSGFLDADSSMTPAGISHQDLYARDDAPGDVGDEAGRDPLLLLYMQSCDDDNLSSYQCLVRKQIEIFEAKDEDIESNAQGRNRPIVPGQVGIRCRHCSRIPPRHRTRGATYYPAKLNGLYQAAQNMASAHLGIHCQLIPDALRRDLTILRDRKSSAGGGKQYWADCVRILGVEECDGILRFRKQGETCEVAERCNAQREDEGRSSVRVQVAHKDAEANGKKNRGKDYVSSDESC